VALILASSSPIRRQLLDAAGVAHETAKPDVDEAELKLGLTHARDIALRLAEAKAVSVPGEWVIGSDSAISVDGRLFDKPADREQAEQHLRFFSGRLMELSSAVALARAGALDWSHVETARLRVRTLTDDFIHSYLDAEWPAVAYCVGVFRMEGRGVQLFDSVEGDHFAILGMPLIALLAALRERGLVEA
jgi:septum formation protein